jgi:hypothetical protein
MGDNRGEPQNMAVIREYESGEEEYNEERREPPEGVRTRPSPAPFPQESESNESGGEQDSRYADDDDENTELRERQDEASVLESDSSD